MRQVDVAIVGGGLAGSLAAAMLGRAGFDALLIDPHAAYPADFRCEKLDGPQAAILRRTGLADAVLPAATLDGETWVARFGRLVDKRQGDQYGIRYEALVNTVRAAIPQTVPVLVAKASAIAPDADRQNVMLSSGETITARLVVLATGLNVGLRHSLGLGREIISACHSITVGFDIKPLEGTSFPFPSLTYYSDDIAARTALLTLFPIGAVMRANLFIYRQMDDPWLQELRAHPAKTLFALMRGLRALTGSFEVDGRVMIRPIDLYVTHGHQRDGIALVGDAFATSCPAAGTGARRALMDVERLCNIHIPQWLTTPGMAADKIAAFYNDPVKKACDEYSLAKAYDLRSFSLDGGLYWRCRRWSKFAVHTAAGGARRLRRHLADRDKSYSGAFVTPEVAP
jgi:2-polyprenyl-6-methoxyphenol hydroxylase-like FAD-dependent oxidoreductase